MFEYVLHMLKALNEFIVDIIDENEQFLHEYNGCV